jgi:lysozyme
MNDNGLKLIQHYESLHDGDLSVIGLQPKMDPVGIWTEGWGHAMTDAKGNFIKGSVNKKMAYALSKVKTPEQATALMLTDLQPIVAIIHRKITIALNDDQIGALASFIYNTGGSSTLYSLINAKSSQLFEWWCNHYITGQGVKLPGLIARRKTEAHLFCTGELKFFN